MQSAGSRTERADTHHDERDGHRRQCRQRRGLVANEGQCNDQQPRNRKKEADARAALTLCVRSFRFGASKQHGKVGPFLGCRLGLTITAACREVDFATFARHVHHGFEPVQKISIVEHRLVQGGDQRDRLPV